MLVPEELGGGSVSGNGPSDLALVAHAFGAHVAPGPLIPCNVVATALVHSGSEQQQSEVLPALIAGELIATWADTELPPHDTLGAVALRAEADGDGYVLTGVKSPVEAGAQADHLLVTAITDAGLTQFLVPADAEGLTITPLRSVDIVRRYARVQFDGVKVAAGTLVGAPGDAAAEVEAQVQIAGGDPVGRDVRCGRLGLRHQPRLGVQPLLVRSPAGFVPGDQAPLRRHEDVARGQPRARRQRGPSRVARRSRRRDRGRARRRRTPASTSPS